MLRRTLIKTLALAATTPAFAQDFPSRPITLLVPYNAGGITDQLAREVGARLSEQMKQPVVVENRAGGGGQVAANALKAAPADGYTVFISDFGPLVLNGALFSKLNYDVARDMRAVTRLIDSPSLLVVPPNSPWKSVDALFKAAKSGEARSYASPGVGSGGHLFGAMLSKSLDTTLTHVAYRGSGPGLIDVSSGQVAFMFDSIVSSGAMARSGRVQPLAIGSDRRSPMFPDVPTLKELGYESLAAISWFGAMVKAGTPDAVVNRLNAELRAAITDPAVAKKFTDQGVEVVTSTPQEFSNFIRAETGRWTKVIRDANITVE